MCGITARAGTDGAVVELLCGLETLECRGFDATGVALRTGDGIAVRDCAGRPTDLAGVLDDADGDGVAIGHTRWSPAASRADDHVSTSVRPPTDCAGEVAVVVDGRIANAEHLRHDLVARGHDLDAEDGVVAHLVEEGVEAGDPPATALRTVLERLEGTFALLLLVANRDAVYAARSGSPLSLGVADDGYVLASAVPAFLSYTDTVVSLEDGDVAVVTPSTHAVTDLDGNLAVRPPESVGWTPPQVP